MARRSSRDRGIPEPTIARLPIYQRIAAELLRAGFATISSEQLGRLAGVTAAKVRKDLSAIGSLGTRGTGYDAAALIDSIGATMGAGRRWAVVIAGAGNLGRALVNTHGFLTDGYDLVGLVDSDPEIQGTSIGGAEVSSFDALADRLDEPVDIGVITVPARSAQAVADGLIALGAHSLLNFAPAVLSAPPQVRVRYVDLSIELQVLSHHASATNETGLLSSVGIQPIVSADAEPGRDSP